MLRMHVNQAIHHFNEQIIKDQRVESVLLTVRDGLSLIIKNSSLCGAD